MGSAAPAREAAPAIAAAMRRLAQVAGADLAASAPTLERLETSAFNPSAASKSVDATVIEELRDIARQWYEHTGPSATATAATAAAASLLAAVVLLGATTWADDRTAAEHARALYREALDETDRQRRVRLFASAERAWRPLAAAHPAAAELQVDWGNAALGRPRRGPCRTRLSARLAQCAKQRPRRRQPGVAARPAADLAAATGLGRHAGFTIVLARAVHSGATAFGRQHRLCHWGSCPGGRARAPLASRPCRPRTAPSGGVGADGLGRSCCIGFARQRRWRRRRGACGWRCLALGGQCGSFSGVRQSAARRHGSDSRRIAHALGSRRACRSHTGLAADERSRHRRGVCASRAFGIGRLAASPPAARGASRCGGRASGTPLRPQSARSPSGHWHPSPSPPPAPFPPRPAPAPPAANRR